MSLLPMARLISECSLYFTVLLILPLNWSPVLLAGTAILCGLGCSAAQRAGERTVLRCLCALLPPLALLIPGETIQRAGMAAPVLYAELLILTGHVDAEAWLYARHVKLSAVFELLFLTVGCTLRTERAVWLLLCGNLYFIFSVYYQHQLRLGAGVSWRGKLQDLVSISILPVGSGAVCALIAGGMKPIGRGVIAFTSLIGSGLRYVVGWCTHLFPHYKIDPVKVTTVPTEAKETMESFVMDLDIAEDLSRMDLDTPLFLGLVLVGALALLGLLFYGIHRFRMHPTAVRKESHWAEAETTIAEHPARPRAKATSNRRKVRKTYTAYLRLLQGKGMFRRLTDTSQDVLNASAEYTDPEKSRDLRNIYIRARYHTDLPVPDEDVRKAGEILRELRK